MGRWAASVLVGVALLTACTKTPDYVIGEGDMAELLADMHEGEAVVELNPSAYRDDSVKKALKQSILMKNGVTQEQFDTSLIWYGHNLDVYNEVYEDVVSILEKRQEKAREDAVKAGEKLVAAGDSVDIWDLPHSLLFDRRQAGGLAQVAFSYPADSETKPGDRFVWKLAMVNTRNSADMLLGVDYSDGTSEYQTRQALPGMLVDLILQSDSARTISRVYGYMTYRIGTESSVFADKITLSRTRFNREIYTAHPYQRKVK